MINIALAITLTLAAAEPDAELNTNQLSRSMVPRGVQNGFGCLVAAQAGATAQVFGDGAVDIDIPINSQIYITNTSTDSAAYCVSQDWNPSFTSYGVFAADDLNYYPAGRGNCFILAPGSHPIYITPKMWWHNGTTQATRHPGSKAFKCASSNRSCSSTAECLSAGGVCAAANGKPTHVRIAVNHRVGADGLSFACDAR